MRNLDILAAESGEHVRVLLCREEQSYVVSCQHFRMPYPVASDLLAELQPVPAETYSVFVLDEDITNRQREGRNRKLDLIAPLLVDTCIYDKSHRNEVVLSLTQPLKQNSNTAKPIILFIIILPLDFADKDTSFLYHT